MLHIKFRDVGNNFNSIKVQLEHALLGDVSASGNVFQFHKGTIRTNAGYLKQLGKY